MSSVQAPPRTTPRQPCVDSGSLNWAPGAVHILGLTEGVLTCGGPPVGADLGFYLNFPLF